MVVADHHEERSQRRFALSTARLKNPKGGKSLLRFAAFFLWKEDNADGNKDFQRQT